MKTSELLLLSGLLATGLVSAPRQDPQGSGGSGQEAPKKRGHPITAFPKEEGQRLEKEIQGSWVLVGYADPNESFDEGALDGFATFHDGFLTLFVQGEAVETGFFGQSSVLIVQAGAYRYRFDEMANLQTSSVMSFTNMTDDGELSPDPAGMINEYLVNIKEGVLELRTPDGVVRTFRQIKAGDFPEGAIRGLEKQRGGVDSWPDSNDRDG